MLSFCVLATPVASPISAMMFANTEWARVSDLYKYGWISLVIMFGIAIILSWLWASIIF